MRSKQPLIISICIIILITIGLIIVLKKDNPSEVNQSNTIAKNILNNDENTNEIEDIDQRVVEPTQTVLEYIETIYPVRDGDLFPTFEKIEDADKYWIWSTALNNSGETNMGSIYASKNDIISSAKKLYDLNDIEFPTKDEELIELDLQSINGTDNYSWLGNSRSIPKTSHYVVTRKKRNKNKDLYEIEIAEYLVYEWAEPYVLIEDVEGNIIQRFDFNEDYTNSEEMEAEIKKYVDNNINNFDKKVLTIKYDIYTGLYHIISSKAI